MGIPITLNTFTRSSKPIPSSTPSLNHNLLDTSISIVRAIKLPRLEAHISEAQEKMRSAAHEEPVDAK